MANKDNVSAGKPKIGGAVFVAPAGTKMPKTAIEELDKAFKNLGYVSEDGIKNSNSPENETFKAWGGDVVLTTQTEKPDTFSMTLIEVLSVDVLKMVYGEKNVDGTLETGITIRANAKELEEHTIVIDMIMRNGVMKRFVIPSAKITETEEIEYNDGNICGYGITLTAEPDENGDTHKEYIIKKGK